MIQVQNTLSRIETLFILYLDIEKKKLLIVKLKTCVYFCKGLYKIIQI